MDGIDLFLIVALAVFAGIAIGIYLSRSRGFLIRIFRGVGRRLRLLPKKTASYSRKAAGGGLGVGGHSSIVLELQSPLSSAEDEAEAEDDVDVEPLSFDQLHDVLIQKKSGYKTFKVPNKQFLLYQEDSDVADDVARFFQTSVQIRTDADNLYDEEEGIVLARVLNSSDRNILYAIDRFRAMVGDNARKIVLISAVIAAIPSILAVGLSYAFRTSVYDYAELQNNFLIIVGILYFIFVLYLYFSNTQYSKARDTSFGAFSAFLQNYFSGISDAFLTAHSNMSNAIAGETDTETLEKNAINSHRAMLWYAFRLFLVESFLRNEYYQTRRNLRFYQLLYTMIIVLISIISFSLVSRTQGFPTVDPTPSQSLLYGLILLTFVFGFLVDHVSIGKTDAENEIQELDWRGFKDLKIDEAMSQVIGSYAKEAAIGKNRFTRK
ncbi:MAG: hypothetical protein AAF850_01325 [Pseudomonadota bacterium]